MTMTLSDWYHEEAAHLVSVYQSKEGSVGVDDVPTPSGGVLVNSGKNVSIHVKPDTTYLVRIICTGSYPGHAWKFDGHNQTTVEIDGVYTKPVDVNADDKLTRIAPGQRQAVLIHTKNETDKNYAIFDIMDMNMLFINKGISPPPADYNANGSAWFVYNDTAPLPEPPIYHSLTNSRFWDDCDYEPLDGRALLGPVGRQIVLDVESTTINGISRYTINGEVYYNLSTITSSSLIPKSRHT
jgi:iron transport multicopper oxidase